jgi:endoglucanase
MKAAAALLVCSCLLPPAETPSAKPEAAEAKNLLKKGRFEDGRSLPWTSSFSAPAGGKAQVVDGELCLDIANPGANRWDAQLRHREMIIQKGHTYQVRFRAHASRPTHIRPKVGMQGPPYAEYWFSDVELSEKPRVIAGSFHMDREDDPTAELALHAGGDLAGSKEPVRICIDDVVLGDPQFQPAPPPPSDPIPTVLVSQLGYLPRMPKIAAVRSSAKEPLRWQLRNAKHNVVASGTSLVSGRDAASGDELHLVDFSAADSSGRGYVLEVDGQKSHPFAIEAAIYRKLKSDALAYFYHNRSGIEITMPRAGDPKWTRPAGHLSDKSVPCLPGSGCSYSLDVSGGWYDAGDHGKYVVNGGIAVWTLLNLWERTHAAPVLEEARWEMEFLLRMQVPEGQPLAGMAHHKIHDFEWTALGLAPHEDPVKRYLYPPSTAATLNLAATAAQCARVWRTQDPPFAAKCLDAAERAYVAALAHPAMFASTVVKGGGPYDDDHVSDEFYWAAAELFVTTGKPAYHDAVVRSSHYGEMPAKLPDGNGSAMSWGATQALGTISLAMVPNALGAADVDKLRKRIIAAADGYIATMGDQGYRVPFAAGPKGYPWGSNSFVLNNLIVVGLAFDFTHKPRYAAAVAEGFDYLLGRNPLDQSFITGYGARPLLHPHHRFWAQQTNAKYPPPPPGAISGGPNSGLEDPYVQAAGLTGCAPQKCFADHIESFSSNEVAINWNAPLVWVVSFLDTR